MRPSGSETPSSGTPDGRFRTTQWSVVVAAGHETTAVARQALEILCCAYWKPLYFFLRRRGHPVEDAEDLIQGFFAHLLERGVFQDVRPELGRFRSFLLAALQNFVANELRRGAALKRGGGARVLSLDTGAAERCYRLQATNSLTPDRLYLREWAATVVARAMERLEERYAARQQDALLDQLRDYVTDNGKSPPYLEIARELNMTEGAVRVAFHRMRKRLGDLLRQEIGQTVMTEGEIDDEIVALLSAPE